MKVPMKRFELLSIEYAKKFKNWEQFIIASDAYLAGLKESRRRIQDRLTSNGAVIIVDYVGEETVEIDFTDGTHQLTETTFQKWKNNENL